VGKPGSRQPNDSAAFLLAQVGAHASAAFAQRLTPLGLSPPHAGILRVLGSSAGVSQQWLASLLKIHPSRLVAIMDELESMGLVDRRENPDDRRVHSLHLTKKGESTLGEIGRIGREHNEALLRALKQKDREELVRLLRAVADEQGLTPGVHSGYSRLGAPRAGREEEKEP
jgi:DNA-binding MarR family transcriptional regulator